MGGNNYRRARWTTTGDFEVKSIPNGNWRLSLSALMIFIIMAVTNVRVDAQRRSRQAETLLESGAPAHAETLSSSNEIRIVTYNIRWRSGNELDQIVRWLKATKDAKAPVLIALQEVDRAKLRSGKINHARAIADNLGMYYAWTAPQSPIVRKKNDEEETGVELLSHFPLTEVGRITLPHAGPGGRSRVALGATIGIGKMNLRVYSVHSETRIPISEKIEQLRAVLDDLAKSPQSTPAIVMGDFNTWEIAAVGAVRKLFTDAGFKTPFPDDGTTFLRSAVLFDLKLKLDCVWLRGLTSESYGIDRSLKGSDHFPLWTIVKISN